MASNSATTLQNGQTYLTAGKIVNLVKGLPIGVMVTGNAGIRAESIATMLKDLRQRLDGSTSHQWKIDRAAYTMGGIAAYPEPPTRMRLCLCGYSAGRPLPEVRQVLLQGKQCDPPLLLRPEE